MIHVEPPEALAKARIIEIMGHVKLRLRQRGIYMGVGREEGVPQGETLIDRIKRINPYIDVSGGRFSDIFLSRPHRLVNAKVAELTATFECLVGIHPQVLPAHELLELCNLMRVPLNELNRFATYYSADEWREALKPYNLAQQHLVDQLVLVGRESLVATAVDILAQLYYREPQQIRHLVLSGPSGIGKSALVLSALQQSHPINRERTFIVYLHDLCASMEDIYRAIGQATQLPPYGNETWQQRLAQSTQLNHTVVVLDNLQDYARMSAEHVLTHVMRTLPLTHFVVTTQIPELGHQNPHVHEIAVPPLPESAARELFWMVYDEIERAPLASDQVDALLAETHYSPMQIIMLANRHTSAGEARGDTSDGAFAYMSPSARHALNVLTLMNAPVRLDFLAMLLQYTDATDLAPLRADIWALRRRQLIQQQRHNGLVTHDAIRMLVLRALDPAEFRQFVKTIGETVAHFSHELHIEEEPLIQSIQDYEIMALYELLTRLRDVEAYEVLAYAIVRWRMIGIRFGLSAELCALATDCLHHLNEHHPVYAEVLFAIGSFYGHRGLVDNTYQYLQRAMTHADKLSQSLVWAKSALECGLHALPHIGWRESERLLLQAMASFEHLGELGLMARCQDTLAYIYFVAGEIRQAMRMNDMAINAYSKAPLSYGIAEAYSNRGLIFMALGDYELARHEMMNAEQRLIKLNAPASMAAVHLRLAAVHVLAHNAKEARYYLTKAFRVLERSGGINDIMYLVDIYAGVLLSEGKGRLAYQLSDACTHVRQVHGLPRGEALDQMVKRQLEYAQVLKDDTSQPIAPMSAHISDLVALVRAQLLPNHTDVV